LRLAMRSIVECKSGEGAAHGETVNPHSPRATMLRTARDAPTFPKGEVIPDAAPVQPDLVELLVALLPLRPDPLDLLDLQRRSSALFRDLAVLLHDEAARGFVAVEAAEQLGGHAPVGALGAVLVDDVEEGEFAFRVGSGFLGHGGLVVDQGAAVK